MKIIFWGTPQFAVPVLEALVNKSVFDVVGVVTNPDEPAGRKKKVASPPVKQAAEKYGVPVLQPEKLRNNYEFIKKFQSLSPDICIVAAYGKIIPKEYLEIPKYGFISVHPSLLPQYRGPTPVQTAVLNGDKETGVTIMLMDEEMDHGPTLASEKLKMKNEKHKELEEKLFVLGAELLINTLKDLIAGKIKPKPQDHSQATFTRKFVLEDGKIDWAKPAEQIYNQIRAISHEPGTYTFWNGRRIKIFDAETEDYSLEGEPGKVLIAENKLLIKTGAEWLNIKKLQLEGKSAMLAKEFIKGYPKIKGNILD